MRGIDESNALYPLVKVWLPNQIRSELNLIDTYNIDLKTKIYKIADGEDPDLNPHR
jgi:hypothetical protein